MSGLEEKNEELTTVVKELGFENSQLKKENKDLKDLLLEKENMIQELLSRQGSHVQPYYSQAYPFNQQVNYIYTNPNPYPFKVPFYDNSMFS